MLSDPTPQQTAETLRQAVQDRFQLSSDELLDLVSTLAESAPYICHRCGSHGVHQQDNCKKKIER